MVTIKDIAEKAGVSPITVSRVLTGRYPNKVGAKTRERVLQIADQLGYRPNIPAKALRGNRTLEFGLVVPKLDISFIPEVVQGLQQAAMEAHYSCLLYVTELDPDLEFGIFQTLISRNVDGIIWLPSPTRHKDLDRLLEDKRVVQLLYKQVPGKPALLVDQELGAYQATRHLVDLGHRRIGNLGLKSRHGTQRVNGYYRALREAGIEIAPELVRTNSSNWDASRLGAHELLSLEDPPSAIVCYSDLVAWAALRAARDKGLAVPDDLSLVGFDNFPYIEYVEPPLTTIEQPKQELGKKAMSMLVQLIEGESVSDLVLSPKLIVRGSTAAAKH